jgi:uncharacterized protein with HEPN domain
LRGDNERLQDILEAIAAIRRYTATGRERFDEDELVRVWCARHLEVIGESVAGLSDGLRAAFPDAPWRQIIGMRNVLIHAYFDVDWDEIWGVVERDLGPLEALVRGILSGPQGSQ